MGARITIPQTDIEAVYEAIYAQLRAEQTLPLKRQLAEHLSMEPSHVDRCLLELRAEGRIELYTLLPTDYSKRWREMPVIKDSADTLGSPLRRTRRSDLIEQ